MRLTVTAALGVLTSSFLLTQGDFLLGHEKAELGTRREQDQLLSWLHDVRSIESIHEYDRTVKSNGKLDTRSKSTERKKGQLMEGRKAAVQKKPVIVTTQKPSNLTKSTGELPKVVKGVPKVPVKGTKLISVTTGAPGVTGTWPTAMEPISTKGVRKVVPTKPPEPKPKPPAKKPTTKKRKTTEATTEEEIQTELAVTFPVLPPFFETGYVTEDIRITLPPEIIFQRMNKTRRTTKRPVLHHTKAHHLNKPVKRVTLVDNKKNKGKSIGKH